MTLTSVKKDTGEASSETRKHPVLRTTFMICAAFAAVALAVLVLGAISADESYADDVVVDGATYTTNGNTATLKFAPADAVNFTIPEKVTYNSYVYTVNKVSDSAFVSCDLLETLTISSKNRCFGATINFYQCTSLREFIIGPGVTYYVVDDSGALIDTYYDSTYGRMILGYPQARPLADNSYTIPSNVKSVGPNAFRGVPIQSLTIPSSVEYIRSYAFYGNAIQNLTIPGTVRTIETYAFSSPTTQKVVIEEGVVSIAKYAFGCPTASDSNITDLTVPVSIYNNMRTDESQRYINTSKLQRITFTGTGLLEMPSSYSSTVKPHYLSRTVLQEVNIGPGITGLANNFLDSFPELTTVIIADNPDRTGFSVGDYTFRACKKLTNIDTSVFTSIGNSAFVDAGLQTITLSSALTSIGDRAFQRSDSASSKTATVHYNCENASYAGTNYAFNYGMDSTSTVIIGSTVKQIPGYLFKNSSSIISMTNNKVLQTIGSDSFVNCTVSDLVLPNTIVSISEDAFTGATVTNLTVPGTVPTVNQYTFPKVINLTYLSGIVSHYYVSQYTLSLDIGYYVTAIDDQVFSKGRNITTITVDEDSDYFWFTANGTMLFFDTDLSIIWYCGTAESVEIPTNVEKIGLYAFYGHDELKSIQLSPSLNVIGESAFEGTGLTAVRLPDTVAIIGAKAFFEARSLAKITIADDDDFSSIGADAFNTKYSTDPTFYSMFVVNSHNQKIDLTTRFPSIYGETVVNTENNVPGDITTPVAAGNLEFTFIGGVLTINSTTRGTTMDAYTETDLPPWVAIRDYITEIVIGDGVTKIYTYGISDYPNCTKLTLGRSLMSQSGYYFYVKDLPKLTLLTYRMAGTSSTAFQYDTFVNVGANGFKVLFQSDDGVTMYVPSYLFNGNPINLTEIEFDIGGGLYFGNSSMCRTENVSKITYNVKGNIGRNGVMAIGITDYLGDNVDSLELVIGANMMGTPGSEYIGSNITKVTILSNNITTIAKDAFKDNTKLTAITIPASCTAIGSYAFQGCTALETVVISSVTGDERFQVGVNTFYGCVALKSIDLSRATSIGNNAFYGCTSLECNLDLSNATSIGTQAFSGADANGAPQLGGVVLKDNVWLGEAAFRYSGASFGTVTISSETKWGGDGYYFGGCSVESFIIDYSTTSPSNMFKDIVSDFTMVLKKTPNDFNAGGNPHLGAVTLDSGFSWIKVTSTTTSPLTSAFGFCDRLATVTINKQIVLGSSAFRGCTRLSTVNGFDNITEFEGWSFDGCQSLFFNKGTIEFNGKTIGDRAFRNTSLTGVRLINCTIWNGTTTAYPFGDCPITSVEYTWNLNSADTTKLWWVMKDTTRDYTLTINGPSIPDVTSVEGANGGLHLTKVVIGSGVTGCADSARFTGCVNLSEIVYNTSGIPANTFDSSESGPFRGLTQSIAVSVGASASVPNYMFKGLNVSNALTINNGTTIGSYAFASTSITSVIIPSNSTIGDYAFEECGALASVTINGNPVLGAGLFQTCEHLQTAVFNGSPVSIPAQMFEECFALTGFTIPSTVTSIGDYAFSACSSLDAITLPSGLESIGQYSFQNSGLTSIVIPLSVTSIGNYAFSGCTDLGTVTITDWEASNNAQKLTIGNCAFNGADISSITIPERTSGIGTQAFKNTKISIVDIPETVTQLGGGIFSGAPLALVVLHGTTIGSGELTFNGTATEAGTPSEHGFIARIMAGEDSAVTIASHLFEGSNVRKVEFSGRSLAVGGFAFASCSKLTEMPDKITSIGQSAFRGCTVLKTVVLSNITSGDSYEAFRGCTGIENLTTIGNVSLGTRCFSGCTGFSAVVLSSGTLFDTSSSYFPFPDWTFQNTSGATLSNSQIAGKAFYNTNTGATLRQCYQVSFDVLGLADSILPQPIFPSSPRAIQPELSNIQTGYEFNGYWYYNDEVWDFSDSIVGDMTLVAGIVAKTYAITVDGGDYGTATLTATYNSNTASLGDGINRTGYSVKYLLTQAGGSTKVASVAGGNVTFLGNVGQYTDASGKWIYDIPSAETLTFYVDWAAMRYQQDLIAGTGGVNGTLIVQYDGGIIDYDAPTKSGNSPEGLYIESACTTKVVGFDEHGQPYLVPNVTSYTDADGNWILAELTDLYVKWEVMKIHITLQVSSGEPSADDGHAVATYGESTLQIQDAVRTGYVLAGYYLMPNTTTALIDAEGHLAVLYYSEAIGDNLTDENRNWVNPDVYELTLVARWTPIEYTIRFAGNGALGVMDPLEMTYDVAQNLTQNIYVRAGYNFAGWNTQQDGSGTPYADKASVTNLASEDGVDVFLYAQWTPITYSIAFDSNEGTGTMATITDVAYNESVEITNQFTKIGYRFYCWTVGSTGGQEVFSPVSKLTTTDGATVTLYARWSPIDYTVAFNANGGTGSMEDQDMMYDVSVKLLDNAFTRTGYSFSGWNTVADGSGTAYTDAEMVTNLTDVDGATVTLYAQWTADKLTIHIYGSSYAYLKIFFDGTAIISDESNPPGMTGYVVKGYYADSAFTQMVISMDGSTVAGDGTWVDSTGKWKKTGDITVYTKYEPIVTTVTLQNNEGEDGQATVTYGADHLTSYDPPTRVGHYVEGYFIGNDMYIDGEGNIVKFGGIWGHAYDTLTVLTHWQVNQYTITFMDGDTEICHITDYYGQTVVAPQDPSKFGYTFTGWDKAVPTTIPAEDVTINAQWQIITYTVTYNLDGGVNNPANPESFTVESAEIVFQDPTKEGYSFGGWFTESTFENPVNFIHAGSHEDVEVFAKWTVNQYTITFDSAGGSAVDPIVKDFGAVIDAPDAPTRNGYAFVGWQPALPATMPAQNMTVTAVWSVLPTPSTDQEIDFNVPGAETVVIDTTVGAIADALNDATKTEVKVEGDGWNMVLPKEIVKGATGVVSMGAKTLSSADIDALPQAIKEKVSGKAVFSLSLTDSNGKVTFAGKNVTVTLPYVLKSGESASDVKLFYIDDSNVIHEVAAVYDEASKTVTFSTDHFSYWYIDATSSGSPSSGGGSNIGLIIGIVVAVIAVAAIVGVVVVKKKKA